MKNLGPNACPECDHLERFHIYAMDATFTTLSCSECACPQIGKPSWEPKRRK